MTSLHMFLEPYLVEVYFFYGLAFFTTGMAIALQVRRSSDLNLARSLWLLSAFALIHSFAEWIQVFTAAHRDMINPISSFRLDLLETAIVVTSFLFLFLFGTNLLASTRGGPRWSNLAPPGLALAWFTIMIWGWWSTTIDTQAWLNLGMVWARFLLALPGALLTSYALRAQLPELDRLDSPGASRSCRLASYTFIFYAVVSGIVVPPANFFPANLVNTESFFEATGIPVQIFRALAGVLMAYSIIKTLSIFEAESRRRLEEAERRHTILQERQRFSRDLHDGVIQSLYAIGLNLECCRSLPEHVRDKMVESYLSDANDKLNRTIRQLRNYIRNLQAPDAGSSLSEQLIHLVEEFKGLSMSGIAVIFEGPAGEDWNSDQINHVYHIVQEALYNVVKHAGATQTMVRLVPGPDSLSISISDNGKGFDAREIEAAGVGMGLANMRYRAAQLRGEIRIRSNKCHGTEVTLQIPYRGDRDYVESNAG
ncbi:hypothetical protein SY88_14385 [Clostridiales bacterium PH28_bin88]|nr:hypothetical protein SY88_14385 [Clostridiales bacterium PH28_bin88]